MRILITGGAGFIGSHLTDKYIESDHEVLVVDNLSSGKQTNLNPKAQFQQVDITSSQLASTVTEFNPEIINHHAAQIEVRKSVDDPGFDAQVNIVGSLNLLQTAKDLPNLKKFIFASTGGAIYGDADQMPTPETYDAWPISPYGIAKLSVEHYLYYYHQIYNLPYIALRYGNVYGPRQNPHGEAGVVAIFFQRLLSGQDFQINGPGDQTRDFVYVHDVVDANLKATTSNLTGTFNIGTSTQTSINQLVNHMKQAINYTKDIPHGPAKPGEQQNSSLSFQKAKEQLSWQPTTTLESGLSQTAEFFRSQT